MKMSSRMLGEVMARGKQQGKRDKIKKGFTNDIQMSSVRLDTEWGVCVFECATLSLYRGKGPGKKS